MVIDLSSQLNRIMSMDAFGGLNNSNNTFTASASANYKERITYDANGNIKTYLRNGTTAGGSPQTMDNLTYGYNITSGKLTNNRLRHVDDAVSSGNYTTDIDDQNTDNYGYDEIGNLTKDLAEGINTNGITWSVYGKILSIVKNGNTISYTYDVSGNRISKNANSKTTWYVRDASGNVMGVYEERSDLNNNHVTQTEVHLYGSSRLGIFNLNRDMESPSSGDIVIFERGRKFFELSNHLGNVLATVSDRKLQTSSAGLSVDYYTADVITASDYYPGGMLMPGRDINSSAYRNSINGQEKTPEIAPNTTTAEFWQYDARVVRRCNVDPRPNISISPYNAFAGNPILLGDPLGDTTINGEKMEAMNAAAATTLENATVTVSTKNNKNWINARFKVAFTAIMSKKETYIGIEKLLEGTGVRLMNQPLSTFRFLGPAAAISTLPFTLSSDNISQPELIEQTDKILNEYLKEGNLAGAQAYAETYNKERGRQGYSKIVFRYMSIGEFENRLKPDDDLEQALPFDPDDNLVVNTLLPIFLFQVRMPKLIWHCQQHRILLYGLMRSKYMPQKCPR